MLNKQFKSTVLVSLFAASVCPVIEAKTNPDKINQLKNIVKLSVPFLIASAGIVCLCTKPSQLENDLKKKSEIINYIDKDKISLTKEEIKKYSPIYDDFLSKLYNDSRVIGDELRNILKESALFLIRSHVRLSRNNQSISDDVIDSDVKRYRNPKRSYNACTLSKPYSRTPRDENYLAYIRQKKDMTVLISLYGWEIKSNFEKFDIYYDQSDFLTRNYIYSY